MKLQNEYKILYEKITKDSKIGFASKKLQWDNTNSKVTLFANDEEVHLTNYKLIYEKDGYVYGSTSSLPSDTDVMISGLDEEGNVVFGAGVVPPPVTSYTVSISDTSIEYRFVDGDGEYEVGQPVEVKFTLDYHYDIEHIVSNVDISDLTVTSGTSETEGNWVKATFTMPISDVILTLSADPMILLQTEFPYDHTEGFGLYKVGETNIMLRIYGLPPAGDTVHYNVVAIDSTGTERGLDLTGDYDEYFETMLVEMPDADVTITLFNDN